MCIPWKLFDGVFGNAHGRALEVGRQDHIEGGGKKEEDEQEEVEGEAKQEAEHNYTSICGSECGIERQAE